MASSVLAVPTTDPALEFAILASDLLAHSHGQATPTFDALSKFAKVSADDPLFFEIIGMIGSRAVMLTDFIYELQDEYLDEDLRSSLIAGIREMAQVISPIHMGSQWNHIAPKYLQQSNIRALRLFSRTARQYKPLRYVAPTEREQIVAELEGALQELGEDKHFPAWAISQIAEGLRRLKLMLTHFPMFGHDAVLDQLIKIQAETKANFDFMQRIKEISEHKLVKTLGVLSLIANLLVLPPKAAASIPYYREHVHQIVHDVPKLLGGPPKRLTHQPVGEEGATLEAPAPLTEPPLSSP
jgi:hypothetical protein